jgi:hypothetical protein
MVLTTAVCATRDVDPHTTDLGKTFFFKLIANCFG